MSEESNAIGLEAILNAIQNNIKAIVGGLAVVIIAGGAYLLVQHSAKKAEISAFDSYYALEKSLENAQKEMTESAKDKKNVKMTFSNEEFEKYFKDVARRMEDFAAKNAEYKAGRLAALDLAELLIQYKKNQEAIKVLKSVEARIEKTSIVGGMFNLQMGKALLATEDFDGAVSAFKSITQQNNLKFLHPVAWLNIGLSHMAKGEKQQAVEVFNRVSEEFSNTEPGRAAKTYMRVISMRG